MSRKQAEFFLRDAWDAVIDLSNFEPLTNFDAVGKNTDYCGYDAEVNSYVLDTRVHSQNQHTTMLTEPTIEFKNPHKDTQGLYFVGYLKGKRKKYVEQEIHHSSPERGDPSIKSKPKWLTKPFPHPNKTKSPPNAA